jgi:CheY-like chemotaxis protein
LNQSVLVVEDDPGIRDVLRLELSDQGFGVRTANSGEEALALLEKSPVDLVLLDLRMPGMDGLETAQKIKSRWPALPIVLCTVCAEKRFERFIGNEIKAYLPKPFTFHQLKETVSGALAAR